LRFCFAFFGLDERYGDFSTGINEGGIMPLTYPNRLRRCNRANLKPLLFDSGLNHAPAKKTVCGRGSSDHSRQMLR
jgi:hypothetical protein